MKMIKKDQGSKSDINIEKLSEEDKNKKKEYGKNRCHNMSDEKNKN